MGYVTKIASTLIALLLLSSCAAHTVDSKPTQPQEIFETVDSNGKFSRTFMGTFPIENPTGSLMASDSAWQGPFTAYLACTEGEKLEVIIDNSEPVEISCEGTRHEISGIQKVALTGGVKIKISSSKQTGSWQIQLVGGQ